MLRTIISTAFAASIVASGATYYITTSFAETRVVETVEVEKIVEVPVQTACEQLAQKAPRRPLVIGKSPEGRW